MEDAIEKHLPDDYLDFLTLSDGAHGEIGEQHLILYSAEQFVFSNETYKKLNKDLVVFGSDGGGEAYAFDYRGPLTQVVQLPFIPFDVSLAQVRGASFFEFVSRLAGKLPLLP